MKSIRSFSILTAASLFTFLSSVSAFAFTDRTSSERILKENKAFIEFMDASITNLKQDVSDSYARSYGLHFNADLNHMLGEYSAAYKKIYASQREMAKISSDMLKEQYLESSKKIFGAIAAFLVKNQNPTAHSYLSSAYADIASASDMLTVGEGSYRKVYSYKIFKFQEGIQKVRRGQRHAFMAIFEGLSPETRVKVYHEIVKQERESGRGLFFSRFLDKEGDAFNEELERPYEDVMKNEEADRTTMAEKAAQNQSQDFVERRLDSKRRYKKEIRTAKLLRDGNFMPAEYVMREYIPDFNFRLLTAMFTVLENEEDAPRLDYGDMKIRLIDDYGMLAKDSVLKTIAQNVQVDEDANNGQEATATDEAGSGESSIEEE